MERDEIVTALTKYFATRSDVVVAYVFGSAARNRRLPGSDIDVGILFAKDAGMADASDASPDEAAEQDAFAMVSPTHCRSCSRTRLMSLICSGHRLTLTITSCATR